jgi:hypothetical protein
MQIKLGDLTDDERKIVTKHFGDFITGEGKDAIFEGETTAEIATLKGTLKKERKRADDAEKKAKEFGDLDVDEARDALEAVKSGKLKTDDDVQKAIKTARKEGENAKATELQKTIDSLTADVNKHKLIEPVRRAALEAGVRGDRIDDVISLTSNRFKLDGDKVIVLKDGEDSSMTPGDFFSKDYKVARPEFYAGTGNGGSGAHNEDKGTGGKKTITRAQFNEMPPADQAASMASVNKGEAVLTD